MVRTFLRTDRQTYRLLQFSPVVLFGGDVTLPRRSMRSSFTVPRLLNRGCGTHLTESPENPGRFSNRQLSLESTEVSDEGVTAATSQGHCESYLCPSPADALPLEAYVMQDPASTQTAFLSILLRTHAQQ